MQIEERLSYDDLCRNLRVQKPFTFSRFGDGEWKAILKKEGANCDGHPYYPDMGEALADVLRKNPPYYVGIQGMALRMMGDEIAGFCKDNNVVIPFTDSDILHRASMQGKLDQLLWALSRRNVVVVGNPYLLKLKAYFRFTMVFIPKKNAWERHQDVSKMLQNHAEQMNDTVFLFAAGMMSEVLINELHVVNRNNTYIDVGSLFDPYCGIQSRTYHEKLKI